MSMRDLIDERNRREKLKNSIIKGYNVHYVTQEELARQKRKKSEKAAGSCGTVTLRRSRKKSH